MRGCADSKLAWWGVVCLWQAAALEIHRLGELLISVQDDADRALRRCAELDRLLAAETAKLDDSRYVKTHHRSSVQNRRQHSCFTVTTCRQGSAEEAGGRLRDAPPEGRDVRSGEQHAQGAGLSSL